MGVPLEGRLLTLDMPLITSHLIPVRAIGESKIGREYGFIVDVVSPAADVALKTLIAKPVTLWIQQHDQSYVARHGYVHTARRLGTDGALTTYQIAFASWLHFLKFRKDARIWQDKSADDILTDVFNAHPQARGAFKFMLSRDVPKRSFCVQYEDDWNFVHRILEQEGLFGFYEQADDGRSHMFVITDDLYALPQSPRRTLGFYRADRASEVDALTHWSAARVMQSTELRTRTSDYKQPAAMSFGKGTHTPTMANQGALPKQAEVYEYTGAYTYDAQARGNALSAIRVEEWESRAKRFHGAGGARGIDAGQWFTLENHPVHVASGTSERQFAVIEARWVIENNVPTSHATADYPFSLKRRVDETRAAHQACVGASAVSGHGASGALKASRGVANRPSGDDNEGFYRVEIEVQRRSVPFRSPFEHAKPRVTIQSAIVVGPAGQEVYTDALNRIKVRFHWDRLNDGDENASCWIRVMQSDSGSGYGGVHCPRIGDEVIVSWLDGDCDRPVVMGRLHNGSDTPAWHSNGILSGFKSKEYGGRGYNQLVMDDATGQNGVQLASSSAGTVLHLGYLVRYSGNARGRYLGSGFDLSSGAYGAIRASQGLYVSTHPRKSEPMDASDAVSQLALSESVMTALSKASTNAQANGLGASCMSMKQFTEATMHRKTGVMQTGGHTAAGGTGEANQFKAPMLLMASPSGIGLASQASIHMVADKNVNVVSGKDTSLAVGRSLIASVKEALSVFVQNAGIKLFAGKGTVRIQAQSDAMAFIAQKRLKMVSATDAIEIAAKGGITLMSGGAYIKIADGNIQIHAPGAVDVKGAAHDFSGPTRMDPVFPEWRVAEGTPVPRRTTFSQ
ncbi:type VI secretion system Vgr family protein [Robbsia andropogonis]|uniref:type VI secretion system Vgr family protein n=1 Tax=Robbsia andropogonis TaxID=28092 RepID=UPI002A69DF1F|nr:type VI secretion system Vgr family protein [Robbsia andropogonis]